MFKVPEKYRVTNGEMGSDASYGCRGKFYIPNPITRNRKPVFTIIASDGMDWEHISVSLPFRCPTWDEWGFTMAKYNVRKPK